MARYGSEVLVANAATLNSKGWEFSCPLNLIGGLPERLTQGLLVGKLLVGGLGVLMKTGLGGPARGVGRLRLPPRGVGNCTSTV